MHPEIENLINMALADGEVTERERAIILRKADSLGLDRDEIEMILEGKFHQLKTNANEPKKENVNKCPSCGEIIFGLSQVCSSCGYVQNKSTIVGENSKNLNDSIHHLENLIIIVKSSPKPSFGERLKIVILTYFSFGLYLIYRKFAHKNGDSFETMVARCEKESRSIKMYYGEDKKVRLLLEELNYEIIKIGKERKKIALKTNLGCFSLVIIFIAFYSVMGIWSYKSIDTGKIDTLISEGKIEEAKNEAMKFSNQFTKENALDKITLYEVGQLLKNNNLEAAKIKAKTINDKYQKDNLLDKINVIEIDKLIEEKKVTEAYEKANNLNSKYTREEIKDKILTMQIEKLIEEDKLNDAKERALLINNEYNRKDILEKIKNIQKNIE
jgi:hypothetical protein